MTWFALPTYTDSALTTAHLMMIRDNINESAASRATTAGRWFASTGPYAIAEREIVAAVVSGSDTTDHTEYVPLTPPGPNVTITTGVLAMVSIQSQANNDTAGPSSRHSFSITGATTVEADDDWSCLSQNSASYDTRYGICTLKTMSPGSNTFTSLYRVSSGTGHWQDREMIVWGL